MPYQAVTPEIGQIKLAIPLDGILLQFKNEWQLNTK